MRAASALRAVSTSDDEARPRSSRRQPRWEAQARSTFLGAYAERAAGAGLFDALEPGAGLLGLFELEKALYELRYEIDNRPDWMRIPLRGHPRRCSPPPAGPQSTRSTDGTALT